MVKKVTQFVGFVYGGLMKIGNVRFFSGPHDSVDELFAAMREHYGPEVSGRYVKCENSADTMTQLQESLSDKRKGETDLYELNVNSGSTALREKSGATRAFRLGAEKEEGEEEAEEDATAGATTGATAGATAGASSSSSKKKTATKETATKETAKEADQEATGAGAAAGSKGKGKGKASAKVTEPVAEQVAEPAAEAEVVVKKTTKKSAATK